MREQNPSKILKVNASGRMEGSVSRRLVDALVDRLIEKSPDAIVIGRDVSKGVEFVDDLWINSNFTAGTERNAEQNARLSGSDRLVAELKEADTLVIGLPIYNFGIPAALKAWVDQVARSGLTFAYSEDGPKGLLTGKKAYLVVTSGGTAIDSEIDFATGYMRHVLGFIGITDVTVIPADRLMMDEVSQLAAADAIIKAA